VTAQKIRGIGINVLTSGIDEVAQTIKLRLMVRRRQCTVHVGPDGRVYVECASNPRWKDPPPDEWLVGVYGTRAKAADIEGDLQARLFEIRGPIL